MNVETTSFNEAWQGLVGWEPESLVIIPLYHADLEGVVAYYEVRVVARQQTFRTFNPTIVGALLELGKMIQEAPEVV